jgi:hypothetical protein
MNLRGDAPIRAHGGDEFFGTAEETKGFGKILDFLQAV